MYSKDLITVALKLYNQIGSLRKVSMLINTSHSTISRWKSRNGNIPPRKTRNQKLSGSNIIDALNLHISTNPFSSIKDIKKMFLECCAVSASSELVRLCLKKNNISRKRARYYSEPKDDATKLRAFLDKRSQFVKENRVFVSVDEYVIKCGLKESLRVQNKQDFIGAISKRVEAVSKGSHRASLAVHLW